MTAGGTVTEMSDAELACYYNYINTKLDEYEPVWVSQPYRISRVIVIVEDFKNRIITSPLLLLFCPKRRRRGKKLKVDFLEILSSDFRKISQQRAPYGDLPNDITSDPPPKSGAGPGGPKFGGYPSKISHFRFSGVEISTTVSSAT